MRDSTIKAFRIAGKSTIGADGKCFAEVNDILGYYASTDENEYFAEAFAKYMSRNRASLGPETSKLMEEFMAKVKARNIKGASRKGLSIEDKTSSVKIIGKADLSIKEVSFLQNNIHSLSKDINLFNGLNDIHISDIYNDGTIMSWQRGKLGISNIKYAMDNGEYFCPSKDLLSAFRKLKKGKELTFNEEYSIEALFHESVHSQAIGNYIIQSYSIDNKIMETCVQLYSRQNYVRILEYYGVKPINFEAIKLGGYGYKKECSKLRAFFEKDGVLDMDLIQSVILENSSGEEALIKFLLRLGISKDELKGYIKSLGLF